MHCTNCGHKLPVADAAFCPNCGKPVNAQENEAEHKVETAHNAPVATQSIEGDEK